MTLGYNGRTAAVDGLAVAYGATTDPTVTGRLNGAAVTVESDGSLTEDFVSRLSPALGAPVDGRLSPIGTLFTSTAAG
jgi:hypothetical protein